MINTLPAFFENNEYFIDEKVGLLKFNNAYNVYDGSGNPIGKIKQDMPGGLKALSLFLSKALFPFKLVISDANDNALATVKRGWTLFLSKIIIENASGEPIGYIRQRFKMFRPEFRISDASQMEIAIINGDWKAWNFSITDRAGQPIGTITKKWNGVLKEAFTTADKYVVSIEPHVKEDVQKVAIVASAITIDMVLKESR